MNPSFPDQQAQKLVQAFGSMSATEDLIFFVAGADNMLEYCQDLIEQYDLGNQGPLVREINAQCTAQAVLQGALYAEVRKVLLALNRFHDAGKNHYEILGLPEDATREEVKHAYRSLSKQYHPDKQQDPEKGTQRFMEITGAYHAILDRSENHKTAAIKPWINPRSRPSGSRRRGHKWFFSGLLTIICIMIVISIFLSIKYRKNVINDQMHLYEKLSEQENMNQASAESMPFEEMNQPATEESATYPAIAAPDPDLPNVTLRDQDQPMGENTTPEEEFTLSDDHPEPLSSLPDPIRQNPPDREPDLPLPDQPISKIAVITKTVPQASPVPVPIPVPTPIPIPIPIPTPDPELNKVRDEQDQLTRTQHINTINISLAISSLINQYTRSYNHRDLDAFLPLFTKQATENGHPLDTFIEQYRSLFTHAKTIDLKISNVNWEKKQDTFMASGSFNVSYTYRDNRTREHTGNITFNLEKEQETMKIRSLEYKFD